MASAEWVRIEPVSCISIARSAWTDKLGRWCGYFGSLSRGQEARLSRANAPPTTLDRPARKLFERPAQIHETEICDTFLTYSTVSPSPLSLSIFIARTRYHLKSVLWKVFFTKPKVALAVVVAEVAAPNGYSSLH